MIQTMTIRQQIERALERSEINDVISLWNIRTELHAEFGPDAVAMDMTAHFDDLAVQMGYVKSDELDALKAKVADLEDTLDLIETESNSFNALAISSGYVKLDAGCVVVKRETAERAKEAFEIAYGDKNNDFTINANDWSYEAEAHTDLTAALEAQNGQGWVLPWVEHNTENHEAETLIGDYCVQTMTGANEGWRADLVYHGDGDNYCELGDDFDTADAAKDAAEADYKSRISEFTQVVQPGMVQVSIRGLEVVDDLCVNQGVDIQRWILDEWTAAIDAAKGEG